MKKSLLLLLSVAVSLSMMAAPKGAGKPWRPLNKSVPASSIKAPAHVDIITEQPEGTVVNYVRSGEFMMASFYGYEADYQVGRVKVVYADDGKTVDALLRALDPEEAVIEYGILQGVFPAEPCEQPFERPAQAVAHPPRKDRSQKSPDR